MFHSTQKKKKEPEAKNEGLLSLDGAGTVWLLVEGPSRLLFLEAS